MYRVITHHDRSIVLSHTNVKHRVFTHETAIFVLSHVIVFHT